jgi:hypothetical protein
LKALSLFSKITHSHLLWLQLHRRCFWDDGWGVEEALDEPGEDGRGLIVAGRHWLLLGKPNDSEHRKFGLEMFHRMPAQTMAFAPLDFVQGNLTRYAEMFQTEVNIQTLGKLEAKFFIIYW